MNVILVVFDTLRYDYLGANGSEWVHTPNLDRFAAEATVFDNSYAASYPTIPHRTDVITGRYGAPFHPWLPLRFDAVALPQVLAANGHATQLICDTPHLINGGHNFDFPFHAWHFVRGNEVDRHWLDDRPAELPPEQRARYCRPDGTFHPTPMQYIRNNRHRVREDQWPSPMLFADVCRWLEDNRRRDNFFLWVDCFDPHEPWDPPTHYVELYAHDYHQVGDLGIRFGWEDMGPEELTNEQLARIRIHYAGEVTMADAAFGRMLDKLELTGLARNTIVIVTSDHGTNLGAHGHIHKDYPLWDQVAHTVLMVRVPGRPGGIRRKELIQPQDIFPTVCELLDVEVPETVEGHSFAHLIGNDDEHPWPRQVVLSSAAIDLRKDRPSVITIQDAEWCLLDAPDPSRRRLYHKPTDPEEEDECLTDFPDVAANLHEKLLEELKARGAHPALVDWFATGEKREVPPDYRFRDPYLDAYVLYFSRILPEETE